MTDLLDLPVVDNHCHAVDAQQGQTDLATWRALFTESPDPQVRRADVATTATYRRLLAAMERWYGVEGESAVLKARAGRSAAELVTTLYADAGIEALVVDTGFPSAASAPPALMSAGGVRQARLLRLELLFQDLVAAHPAYDDLLGALAEALLDVRGQGFAGFKSIVGYRTGLDVRRWAEADARAAFAAARAEAGGGAVRLGHQPLLDTMLHVALAAAAAQELPVQFHVGYGDPDVDLRQANPLALRAVLEEPAYRGAQVVLLHGCWPYVREGAFLAAVYGNAHLDLSYAIPFLSVGEMTAMTRAALGAAPTSKLMYSSDGARVPELHWLGAHDGRRVLGACLDELVRDGDLPAAQREAVAVDVLAGNARRLYGLA